MGNTILVFLGAGIGGVLRYWISYSSNLFFGKQFPYGTFIVNVSGCFLMGLIFVLILGRVDSLGSQLRALLLIGLLGGYTTFSSFSVETINLFENGNWSMAFMNILLNTLVCIIAAWVGMICARQL